MNQRAILSMAICRFSKASTIFCLVSMDSTDGAKSDNRCFNCQGDHSLMNCPHPKNYQEISKNRAAFMKNQPKLM